MIGQSQQIGRQNDQRLRPAIRSRDPDGTGADGNFGSGRSRPFCGRLTLDYGSFRHSDQDCTRAFFSIPICPMKTPLMILVITVIAANLVACATPEERAHRDAERRKEDAAWEKERRERDREDREDDRRYGRSYGYGRHYWY
jgi:hypothetical protein